MTSVATGFIELLTPLPNVCFFFFLDLCRLVSTLGEGRLEDKLLFNLITFHFSTEESSRLIYLPLTILLLIH